jgi:acid phosphatase (class A)
MLTIPEALASSLAGAVNAGRDDAEGWARIHPTGSTSRFERDAIGRIGAPPTGAEAEVDLDAVRDAARTRTADGNARAVELAKRAGWDTWEAVIADIGRVQGPDQARRAAHLVQLATSRTDAISDQGKRDWARARPYQIDPSIDPIVARPGTNPSYPSGHASGAYAAGLILAALVPERAAELVDLAAEVAYSRVYGGVHFPSDVIAGARFASAVVTDVLRREAAGLPQR